MADPLTREEIVFMAKLAEQAERYDDMVEATKNFAKLNLELTAEERNLLSVAYKNTMGARRASWRIIFNIKQKEENKGNATHVERFKKYRSKIEKELSDLCYDILNVLNNLIPDAATGESKVFYYTMKGDYYRYLAEFYVGDERKAVAEESLTAYQAGSDIANKQLPTTHPIRLGLALNFSIFYYEVLNSPQQASHLAKTAFDDALTDLDKLPKASSKDSVFMMQLLRGMYPQDPFLFPSN